MSIIIFIIFSVVLWNILILCDFCCCCCFSRFVVVRMKGFSSQFCLSDFHDVAFIMFSIKQKHVIEGFFFFTGQTDNFLCAKSTNYSANRTELTIGKNLDFIQIMKFRILTFVKIGAVCYLISDSFAVCFCYLLVFV